jgi:hypothetical protein
MAGLGLTDATRRVAEHARSVVRLELQLAAAELKKKLAVFGAGIGFALVAAVFAFFALGFGLAAAAAAIALEEPLWLALLIVFGALLLLAMILGGIGVVLLRKGAKPVPEQAIEEAQLTTEALRNGDRV